MPIKSNDLITKYFKLQDDVYEYFGYKEDWVVIPLNDDRDYFWHLIQDEEGCGNVIMWKEYPTVETTSRGTALFINEIYTQRFLPKWVYRGKEWTMICVDTHCDGNKFLSVLDNEKEIKNLSKELTTALSNWL